MALLDRVQRTPRSELEEQSALKQQTATSILDTQIKKQIMTTIGPDKTKLLNKRNERLKFMNATFPTNRRMLFYEPYFYPFPGLNEAERFNATARLILIIAASIMYYIYIKSAFLSDSIRIVYPVAIGFILVISVVAVSYYYKKVFKDEIAKLDKDLNIFPQQANDGIAAFKSGVNNKLLGDVVNGLNGEPMYNNHNARDPMRQEATPFSTRPESN